MDVSTTLRGAYSESASDTGAYSTSSASLTDVTNMSVTIKCSGRRLRWCLIGTSSNPSSVVANNVIHVVLALSDNTVKDESYVGLQPGASNWQFMPTSIGGVINPGVGTHSLKLRVDKNSASSVNINYCKLAVWEI